MVMSVVFTVMMVVVFRCDTNSGKTNSGHSNDGNNNGGNIVVVMLELVVIILTVVVVMVILLIRFKMNVMPSVLMMTRAILHMIQHTIL